MRLAVAQDEAGRTMADDRHRLTAGQAGGAVCNTARVNTMLGEEASDAGVLVADASKRARRAVYRPSRSSLF